VHLFRKLVILSHRYLGIGLSLLVVWWFASGIVMIYSGGMPQVTPQLRLEQLPALDFIRTKLTPAEAAARAGLEGDWGGPGGRVLLLTVMNRPAYRFGGETTVFADTGEVMETLSLEQSRTAAGLFLHLPEERLWHIRTLTEVDQWTLGQGRQMPLHKFAADDGYGTEVYVQPKTAEMAMYTTRRSRTMAWAGTIPHWLYFTALRSNQPVWYRLVVWTSGLACVVALLGLVLGVTQFRWSKPLRLSAAIPYSGWMRWHYITGVIFGVFTLTWAFSGLLSMEPFAWTRAEGLELRRDALTGGPVELAQFGAMDAERWGLRADDGRAIKEIEFVRLQGEHYYIVRRAPEVKDAPAAGARRERLHQPYGVAYNSIGSATGQDRLLVAARGLHERREPFSVDSIMARLRAAVPDAPVVEQTLLTDYDSYYYSRGRLAPLPVVRVKFADPAETWVYVDPEMSQVVAQIHRLNRVERWLYNGLHSLDFSFWYNRRPLWDIGVIALCLGGLASSGIGLFLGIKRLKRGVTRT
jgi:hypothetical protein